MLLVTSLQKRPTAWSLAGDRRGFADAAAAIKPTIVEDNRAGSAGAGQGEQGPLLIDARRGDVPLVKLRFRCSNCGGRW